MREEAESARLFVAIDLSDRARSLVAAEQKRIKTRAGGALRFVAAEQLHLTLAFMPAVEAARVPGIIAAIERGFDQRAFSMTFSGLGVLPPRGRPRVLYLDVTAGAADVVALQRSVANRLAEQGIALEERAFKPHLTLARWRDGHAADARGLLASASPVEIEQTVSAVTLYQSRLSSQGAVHASLAVGELKVR